VSGLKSVARGQIWSADTGPNEDAGRRANTLNPRVRGVPSGGQAAEKAVASPGGSS